MPHPPKIAYEQPDVEHTVLASTYQASAPADFELDDKLVLYGGGRNYRLRFLYGCEFRNQFSPLQQRKEEVVADLFILNTSFLIWFQEINLGLELPYQSVILHAIQTIDNQDVLYLQFDSNDYISIESMDGFDAAIELIVLPSSEVARSDPLFSQGQNSDTVQKLYNDLSKCSSLHYDSEDDDHEEMTVDDFLHGPERTDGPDHLALTNSGNADDLDDFTSYQPGIAGMTIDVGQSSIVGVVRTRNDADERNDVKLRRID